MCWALGKVGDHPASVEVVRKALVRWPDDPTLLNDLGWSLVLCKEWDEAEKVLERAAQLAAPDYEFPRNNLKELRRRRAAAAKRKQRA
jgi:uncharacterized protein HemY